MLSVKSKGSGDHTSVKSTKESFFFFYDVSRWKGNKFVAGFWKECPSIAGVTDSQN